MTLFDLLFILALLALVIAVAITAFHAVRGRWSRAIGVLWRIAIGGAIYFGVIVAVSLATPKRVVPLGSPQCFDDWCIAVMSAEHRGDSVQVVLRLSSLARGISQGERDVRVYVVDESGTRYSPIAEEAATPLSVTIPPAGEVMTSRRFLLPSGARNLALIVVHDAFPHCCIMGDRESLLHRATVVRL